jgi:hypothetical protein
VPTDELPEEFRKVCEQFGYQLVDSMCSTDMSSLYCQCCDIAGAMPQPITEATNGLPVSCPAPQLPLSQHNNAISINSSSTDLEEEYGVMVTPLPMDATSSDATAVSSSDDTVAPSPVFPCGYTVWSTVELN